MLIIDFTKRYVSFLIIALLISAVMLTGCGHEYTDESAFAYEITDSGVVITEYNGFDEDVYIPPELGGAKVVEIGEGAFSVYSWQPLKKVVLPDGVSVIADNAFARCDTLKEITIPNTVEYIGNSAFLACYELEKISLPQSLQYIGEMAFASCQSVKRIEIPSSVVSIGDNAFQGCTALEEIRVDAENNSFCDIDGVLFDKNENALFLYPCAKKQVAYEIPEKVKVISPSAFYSCHKLEKIILPNGLESIGDMAFKECLALKNIHIPNTVAEIGEQAFAFCTSIEAIEVDEDNPNYCSIDGVLFDKSRNMLIKYPLGSPDSYYRIPEGTKEICQGAFEKCISLEQVDFASSLTTVNKMAFSECQKLKGIYLPESVNKLGGSAFSNCPSLQKVHLSENLTEIQSYAFFNCPMLSEIIIPDNAEAIGFFAFADCKSLEAVYISANTTAIAHNAFLNCNVTIYAPVESYAIEFAQVQGIRYEEQ